MNKDQAISQAELEEVGLIYIEEKKPGIKRQKRGRGFSFIASDGTLIKEKEERKRLLKLAVPPSYEKVWYCTKPNGHLQATGYDSTGKKQYFYHPLWEELRDKNKFSLMAEFGKSLPSFRRKITYRIKNSTTDKERILCSMIRILDKTGMRIGNPISTKTYRTYGLTTLQKKHVSLEKENIHFEYKGKGGVKIQCDLYDPSLATVLGESLNHNGAEVFDYTDEDGNIHKIHSDDINNFIHDHMGDAFSAKDFRTWRFSSLFLEELMKRKNEPDITLNSVLEKIVEQTCNTPSILKSSYIHPGLLLLCQEENHYRLLTSAKKHRGLQKVENHLLAYIRSPHAKKALL